MGYLKKGVYVLVVKAQDKAFVQKIVKQ